ncbi:SRSO17 transposase [Streptomyces sp. TE33382]
MRDYVRGLLGPVGRKNSWQLADFAGHSTPDGLQHLLAKSRWEADEIRDDLQEYVAEHLGADDGILIIDDTGFVKKGITSAGVRRQYSGTAGRTENCQIGVFPAYATTRGHTLVNRELHLPTSWAEDPDRCHGARIPEHRRFATKNEPEETVPAGRSPPRVNYSLWRDGVAHRVRSFWTRSSPRSEHLAGAGTRRRSSR